MSSRVAAALKQRKEQQGSNIAPATATFSSLGIHDWLVEALKAMKINKPTEIQRACIPPILAGKDVIGGAKTGSGKTAAFALPILQKLSEDPYGVFAVVLTPTRELAVQIAEQFKVLGKGVGLKCCTVLGGTDMMTQAIELSKKPHVIIATPGRLRDHIQNSPGAVNLSRVRFLVMDEADRLLESTFATELQVIFSALPKKRQTLLFTATLTNAITTLRDSKEKRPFFYQCDMKESTVSTLDQYYTFVPSQVRDVYLAHIVRSEEFKNRSMIIFCGRCEMAELVKTMLEELDVECTALHSQMSQKQRFQSLSDFRSEKYKVLISTDVGSRGLDIPSVELVINYTLPRDPDDYIHRVGRTARAGRKGQAISIVCERDIELVHAIEARINKQLEEYKIEDNDIVKELKEVTTAKRVASMHLHDSGFEEKIEKKKKRRKVKADE